ncbi:MAG: hypothetical protein QXZ70_00905 [Candidatus Bathyarchaeia archaeon]
MQQSNELVIVTRWNFDKSMYEFGLSSEFGEIQASWELVPGEEIPRLSINTLKRRCTHGAFLCGEKICWNEAPVDVFIDARCSSHIDKRMLCSIHTPGSAVGKHWQCTEKDPLCPSYQRCLSERVCYVGVFAENNVEILKLGETDDCCTRGLLQGLGAIVPIFLKDGGQMSLMRSKSVERELARLVNGVTLNGKFYKVETRPFSAPYKRRTPNILLSFLAADPEKCVPLAGKLAEAFLRQAKDIAGLENDLVQNLSLGDPQPCPHNPELVDIDSMRRLCQDGSLLVEGKLRMKAPRKRDFFGGEILSGKPPHVIVYVRDNISSRESPFLLSVNPMRLGGYVVKHCMASEQMQLSWFSEG